MLEAIKRCLSSLRRRHARKETFASGGYFGCDMLVLFICTVMPLESAVAAACDDKFSVLITPAKYNHNTTTEHRTY